MIISKDTNFAKRAAIRETWKKKMVELHPYITVLFFLAQSTDPNHAPELTKEKATFNDTVVLNIKEDYKLLNYKVTQELPKKLLIRQVVNSLTWIDTNIIGYEMIVKIDDDVWLNVDTFYGKFYRVVLDYPTNITFIAAVDLLQRMNNQYFLWARINKGSAIRKGGKNFDTSLLSVTNVLPPYPNGPLYALSPLTTKYIIGMNRSGTITFCAA
jgi:hypothetical protein